MKKVIKSSLLTLCIFLMAFTALPNILPASTSTPIEVHAEEISPRADVIYWVYRTLSNGNAAGMKPKATGLTLIGLT